VKHWRAFAVVAIAAWIVCVAVWAFHPMTISVHVGTDAAGAETTASVQCDAPLSGNTQPTNDLPTLKAGESFGPTPCTGPVTSGRTIFFIDLLVAGAVLVVLAATRGHREQRGPEEAAAGRSTAVAA